jgi:CubicO group peptidase (beta-lactamase class C family)
MQPLDLAGLDRLMAAGDLPGWTAAVRRGPDRVLLHGGVRDLDAGDPVDDHTVLRIASLSKPVAALVTVQQVEAGRLDLDDPVDRWVPELAGLRVLRAPGSALDDTEPLSQSPTVRQLLTMTSGFGVTMTPTALSEAMTARGIHPGPTGYRHDEAEFLADLAGLPLGFQPGAGWAYHTSTDVLGVVLTRATGKGLGVLVEEGGRAPLGLDVLGHRAPDGNRLATAYGWDGERHHDLDPHRAKDDPPFPTLSTGLCTTAADYLAVLDELVAPTTISARGARDIATAWLTAEQRAAAGAMLEPGESYGFQVSVAVEDTAGGPRAGSIGWAGGTGCLAVADPASDLAAVLLTTRLSDPVNGPTAFAPFLAALYPRPEAGRPGQ